MNVLLIVLPFCKILCNNNYFLSKDLVINSYANYTFVANFYPSTNYIRLVGLVLRSCWSSFATCLESHLKLIIIKGKYCFS